MHHHQPKIAFVVTFLASWLILDFFQSPLLLPMHIGGGSHPRQRLGIFGIEKAWENFKDGAVTYAIWIGVALIALAFAYAAIQTVSKRTTNAAIDGLNVLLRNPYVLGGLVGMTAVTVFFLLPSDVTLREGDHVSCQADGGGTVYRYTDRKLRPYPNPVVARSWGSKWKSATSHNHKVISTKQCDKLAKGPPMLMYLKEGDHVSCQIDGGGTVYRFTEGKLRPYPDPSVARSWGSVWISGANHNHKVIPPQHCSMLEKGPPMPMKLEEGDHVSCQADGGGGVYRFSGGMLRPYPSPEVARSWGSVWISSKNHNHKVLTRPACDAIPKGPAMTLNTSR